MKYFQIGAMMDSFHLPTREAIMKVKEVGATGFQMYSTKGENSPENLTKEKRKELFSYILNGGKYVSGYRLHSHVLQNQAFQCSK